MPRKPQVGYFASRNAYYTKVAGVQYKLAAGPDDSPHGPTYIAALEEFRKILDKSKVDTAGDANTVRTIFHAYLDACTGNKRDSTMDIKQRMLKVFVDRHGDLPVSQVKPFHVEQVIAEMRKERVKGKRTLVWGESQGGIFVMQLKAAFNWAIKAEVITRNPLKSVATPHARSRARERIVRPEEFKTILDSLKSPCRRCLRRLVIALENCGARPGELCNATVGDFNPGIGALVYYADDKRREDEFRHKTAGKGKDRVVYFTGEVLDMVKELCEGKKPGDLLFPNNKGKKYSRVDLVNRFRAIRKRTGLPHVVPYCFRHTLATRWLEAGKPVEALAELLGNTPATIHKHYSHLCRSHATLRGMLEEFRKEK